MNGDAIVSIIAIVAALILALRRLQSRPIARGNRWTMAFVWLLIIVGVVFLIHSLGIGDI